MCQNSRHGLQLPDPLPFLSLVSHTRTKMLQAKIKYILYKQKTLKSNLHLSVLLLCQALAIYLHILVFLKWRNLKQDSQLNYPSETTTKFDSLFLNFISLKSCLDLHHNPLHLIHHHQRETSE